VTAARTDKSATEERSIVMLCMVNTGVCGRVLRRVLTEQRRTATLYAQDYARTRLTVYVTGALRVCSTPPVVTPV